MKKRNHTNCNVVTWQSPSGEMIDLCQDCFKKLSDAGRLPKTELGLDYCNVRQGLHRGYCDHDYWTARVAEVA